MQNPKQFYERQRRYFVLTMNLKFESGATAFIKKYKKYRKGNKHTKMSGITFNIEHSEQTLL